LYYFKDGDWVTVGGAAADGLPYPMLIESSANIVVTSGSTAHTMGAWTEIIASTSEDAGYVAIYPNTSFQSGVDTTSMFDVGIGASGSEVPLVESLPSGFRRAEIMESAYNNIPLKVPAGSRISIRNQSVIPNHPVSFLVALGKPDDRSVASVDVIGANRAASSGTLIASGATGAQGAYVQIVGSTAQNYQAVIAVFVMAGSSVTQTINPLLIDLAVGPSGSEQLLVTDSLQTTTTEYNRRNPPSWLPIYVGDVPAGSRLAMRTSNNRDWMFGIIIGVPYP
jgi:hypothetical protein